METIILPSSSIFNTIHIALFQDITNAPELRVKIVSAATSTNEADRDQVNFAFVEPRLVSSVSIRVVALSR